MALLSQRLTRLPLYDQPIITIQRLGSDVLPHGASAEDYEIDAHTFSAYGTSTDGILYLRRPKRLVVPKSRKPPKAVLQVRKVWPDPRNAREVASFHQKHLASRQDIPLKTTPTIYTCPPQSVNCTLTAGGLTVKANCLIMPTGKTPITSRCIMPPPRFWRNANDRS